MSRRYNNPTRKQVTSDIAAPESECTGDDGNEFIVSFKISFSRSLFAVIRAFSNRVLASGLRSLMNFSGAGQTKGSGDEGFNKAAHAACLCFKATV